MTDKKEDMRTVPHWKCKNAKEEESANNETHPPKNHPGHHQR
jgi:hypothetical protein